MREIKFRGKRVDNGEWIYGDLMHNNEQVLINPIFEEPYEYLENFDANVIPETVGQFTGLYDKNGKEIYEGDIVSLTIIRYADCWKKEIVNISTAIGEIKFFQYGWCLIKTDKNGTRSIKNLFYTNLKDDDNDPDTHIFEVLGNIYGNPEFLEVPHE